MGVYSNTTANAYADQIKVVYEYLDEIRKVGGRLTPVEDLASFQAQIAELHGYLDLLVEASNIIVTATPTGEAILTGSVPSIRTLLGIDNLTGNWVQPEDLQAALDALRGLLLGEIETSTNAIVGINVQLTNLEQYAVSQQAEIDGLQISYSNVAAGLETNQTNTEQALSRLTIREQHATLQDLRLDTIDQSLVSTVLGIQATNDTVAGHTASISTIGNTVNLHTTSIDSLASTLTTLEGDVTANATAIDLMETNITAIGDDIEAESNRITALRSVIGGSGNLLPNAEFASNANGWAITVAEEDWATTLLTVDLFNMPEEVHCLEVLGTPTPLGQIVVESSPVLIQGGKHHIVSGYPCVDNGTITLSYKTFNAAGAVLDQGICPATFNATTSTNINDYTRTWVKFLAAETAVKMRLYMTVTGDGDWLVQGALFRPMIEQSWEGQEEPTAWTPNLEGIPQALAEATEELTTRVTSIEGVNTAQATQITTLEARATTIEGVNTSQATAISGLDTRVTAAEGVNTAQSTSITSLDSRITAAEGVNTSQATAITGLDTRVTTAEGTITAQSSAITSLQTEVAGKASSGTVSALSSRVDVTEAGIAAQGVALTGVKAQLGEKGNLVANSTGADDLSGWEKGGEGGADGQTVLGRNWPAPWTLAPGTMYLFQAATSTDGYSDARTAVGGIEPGKRYCAQALFGVHRCTGSMYLGWFNKAGAQIGGFTGVNFPASNPVSGESVANYDHRHIFMVAPDGAATAKIWIRKWGSTGAPDGNSFLFFTRVVLSEVSDELTVPPAWPVAGSGMAAVTQLMQAEVNSVGNIAKAAHTVVLDVNGNISGTRSENDGTTSSFSVLATIFRVLGFGSSGMEWRDGYLRIWKGSSQVILGNSFGASGDMIFWYGPNIGAAACTKALGTIWFDNANSAYFGGSLSAGVLKNAMRTTNTASNAEIVVGPFTTLGHSKSVVINYKFARTDTAGTGTWNTPTGSTAATITVYRKVGLGAETLIHTYSVTGSVEVRNEPGGPSLLICTMEQAYTFTDATGGTSDFTYRAALTSRSNHTATRTAGSVSTSSSQELGIISTEEP